ncbi:hypothetical protein [Streptomyces sp. NPDC059455]|uniref:hypothetical protein n=1 Tax=Streptomyces sp. NPDC059455 TaxID=3346837 RepID=UPI00368249F1
MESLFDGRHDEEELAKGLASSVEQLLTPAFFDRLRHPSGPLLDALRSADHTRDWKPDALVRLYAGGRHRRARADRERTQLCAPACRSPGLRSRREPGRGEPLWGLRVSAPQAARWFDALAGH